MSEVSKLKHTTLVVLQIILISIIVGVQPTGDSATTDGRGCSLGATLSKIKENPNFCISAIER